MAVYVTNPTNTGWCCPQIGVNYVPSIMVPYIIFIYYIKNKSGPSIAPCGTPMRMRTDGAICGY